MFFYCLRYHTSTFGYELPMTSGDGEYVLILKFCEVYFNQANAKVFDVVLNGEHQILSDLDIFRSVGKGTAHDESIYFSVSRNRLYYKEEESEIRGGKIRVEFIKGFRDNPKCNAIALIKGSDVHQLPKLPPLAENSAPSDANENLFEKEILMDEEKPVITNKVKIGYATFETFLKEYFLFFRKKLRVVLQPNHPTQLSMISWLLAFSLALYFSYHFSFVSVDFDFLPTTFITSILSYELKRRQLLLHVIFLFV